MSVADEHETHALHCLTQAKERIDSAIARLGGQPNNAAAYILSAQQSLSHAIEHAGAANALRRFAERPEGEG